MRVYYLLLFVLCHSLLGCQSLRLATPRSPLESQAQEAYQAGQYEEALSTYRTLVQQHPSPHYKLKLAHCYRLTAQISEAIALYDELLSHADVQLVTDALEGKAMALAADAQFETSRQLFYEVLALDATRWRSMNALAVTLTLGGNKEEALHYFDLAMDLSEDPSQIANNKGLALAFMGKMHAAEQLLEATLKQALPAARQQKISFNLALVYGLQGKMEEAEKLLTPYLTPAAIYNNLGYYAMLRHDAILAKQYLSKALAGTPGAYEQASSNLKKIAS